MRLLACAMLTAMILAGCGASSGIVPIGPDTYVVLEMRAPVLGGGLEARRVLLAEASGFCQQQDRDLFVLDLRPDGDPRMHDWPTAFDATFQCRPKGIPPGVAP